MGEQGAIVCGACGKRFRWKAELEGRHLTCPCGSEMVVPRRAMVAEAYDVFEAAAEDAPPLPRAGQGGVASPARGGPDAADVAARLGIVLPRRSRVKDD